MYCQDKDRPLWQDGWRGAASGGRGARGHGGRGEFSQSLTPAGLLGWGVAEDSCADQAVYVYVCGFFFQDDDESEVAAVCIYPAGRDFSSRAAAAAGRGELMVVGGREEASALHLSRSDWSSVCSSCLQRIRAADRKGMGPVDITAMTNRVDVALDFSTWS